MADIVTNVEPATGYVVIVNWALKLPAGTVTLAGTLATAEELVPSDTTAPPSGAALTSVTVAWEVTPPTTLAGLIENVLTEVRVTVSTAVLVTPLYSALIVTGVALVTEFVVIVNCALVLPAGIVTFAGTLATDDDVVLSDTTAPPAGAAPVSVTVPWEVSPPTTLAGMTPSEDKAADMTVIESVF